MEAIDAVNSSEKNHLILGGHGMWASKVSEAVRDSKNVTFLGTVLQMIYQIFFYCRCYIRNERSQYPRPCNFFTE